MKKAMIFLCVIIFTTGCASLMSQYRVVRQVDKFDDNNVTVTMRGGIIDSDLLGNIPNPAEFNPFVVRSADGKILRTGINFIYQTEGNSTWLNIKEGNNVIFLLNKGADKIVLAAANGKIDYNISSTRSGIDSKHYDLGLFYITPAQLKQIATAKSVEVRVTGVDAFKDFPRLPTNHVVENFLPNFKKFYETEVEPYLKKN